MGKSKSKEEVKKRSHKKERLAVLEQELKNLKEVWALSQASDVIKRFRHHVMYDLTKTYNIELPAKLNPRKRTNWASVCEHILQSERTPEEWKTALQCLQNIEARNKFPFGFWDSTDNQAVKDEDIEDFAKTLPSEYQQGVAAMAKCSLKCTPPCARGKSNAPNKGQNFSVEDIERLAQQIVKEDDE